jgi:G:T-mismatch repair DNA endonuclease (very short patch repair protein)
VAILDLIERVCQSKQTHCLNKVINVEIDRCILPKGGTRLNISSLHALDQHFIARKYSIISPDDFMERNGRDCFIVSLVLALYLKIGIPLPKLKYKSDLEAFRQKVRHEVDHITKLSGIDCNLLSNLPGIHEFQAIQGIMSSFCHKAESRNPQASPRFYRIVIYAIDGKVVFTGDLPSNELSSKPIKDSFAHDFQLGERKVYILNLLLENEHFHAIRSLAGCFARKFFCQFCSQGYDRVQDHKNCVYTCDLCFNMPPCSKLRTSLDSEKHCNKCCRTFYSDKCYSNHQVGICDKVRNCSKCLRFIGQYGHKCGMRYCRTCMKQREIEHFCYIPVFQSKDDKIKKSVNPSMIKTVAESRKIKKKPPGYVFFDFESLLDPAQDGDYHRPCLCVSEIVCNDCLHFDTSDFHCETCGTRRSVFEIENNDLNSVVDSFIRYLITKSQNMTLTVIAHNASGYDGLFILRRLFVLVPHLKPKVVMTGSRIYTLEVERIKFIDSVLFSCCSLSKLPSFLNLGDDVAKGWFPHKFNLLENQHYIGPYPAIEMYEPESMKLEESQKFTLWYDSVKTGTFNFRESLLSYCMQDVVILKKFCLKLTKQMFEESRIEIFRESLTLASFTNKVYRRMFMREDSIGIIPKMGYRLANVQSKIALKYLIYFEKYEMSRDSKFYTAWNGREKTIMTQGRAYKVDGYYEHEENSGKLSKHVVEFQGCYFHQHENCSLNKPRLIKMDDVLKERYKLTPREYTARKIKDLQEAGYIVKQVWECDFKAFLKNNPTISENLDDFFKVDKLDPKDAFFGGRVETNYTYKKCGSGSRIQYLDFCSLYPTVGKYDKNVVGIPKIIIGEDCLKQPLETFEGLIKCRVLPPMKLFHPVLPLKMKGKLLFPLCRTCAELSTDRDCRHSVDERGWIGTYVADELREAITQGYIVQDIFEMWLYEVKHGLFENFMTHFQVQKIYASGIPAGYTRDTIHEFITLFEKREGLKLDPDLFEANAAKRNFSKMLLNSCWGKFGQRQRGVTKIVTEPLDFAQILTNPDFEVTGFKIINENTLLVGYDDKNADPLNTTNNVVCAYTTAMARLRLYKVLKLLGDRCCYLDTDSVIYYTSWDPEACKFQPELPTGSFFGDLTNELVEFGPDAYISEFVSTGAKTYSFRVTNTASGVDAEVCKIKGITLNVKNKSILNFDSMKRIIFDGENAENLTVTDNFFVRGKDSTIKTVKRKKIFRATISKRRLIGHVTYPFGYRC